MATTSTRTIRSTQEHEDHPGQTLITRSHDVIRQWAGARDATPCTVPGTEHDGRPGVLRLDFPGYGGRDLRPISWEEWFTSFDDRDLHFIYQEHKKDGAQSNFFRLDSPHRQDA